MCLVGWMDSGVIDVLVSVLDTVLDGVLALKFLVL